MVLLVLSFVRTIVPAIVGSVAGWLTQLGLQVDPEFRGALTTVLSVLFTGIYYLLVRIIETKFPQVGILLGWAKSPDSYSKGPGVELEKPQGNPDITVTLDSSHTDADLEQVAQNIEAKYVPKHRSDGRATEL